MSLDLDQIDRNLLALLQQDATLSMDTLADRAHLSRNACWRRVKRMEEAGVIRARVALVNPQALGLDLSVIVLIRTNRHDKAWLEAFNKAVRDLPEIIGAHRMSGDLDYVLRVRVPSVKGYDDFYQRLISRIEVSDISASFVMQDIKDTTALPVN
ncbi:MAG: Lrp/AsnC family transcriptional regulator [Pseudomonadota bacterium]